MPAASWTAEPPSWVDLDAKVPLPCSTASVSPWTNSTSSGLIPSRSATIIENVVSWLWPWLNEPDSTRAVPSGVISTRPNSSPPGAGPAVIST